MYTGSIVALVTPMHEDGSVDGDALARLVEFHIENGTNEALFFESNPIPAKWAVGELGLVGPALRLPLTPLSPSLYGDVRDAMAAAQL